MSTHTMPFLVGNILRKYSHSTVSDIDEGMSWYDSAREIARELDSSNTARAAGVIAALSPRMPWGRNVILARNAFANGEASGTMSAFCNLANRILAGEDTFDVLKGDKTRAFAHNIAFPDSEFVAVDRHAIAIAIAAIPTELSLSKSEYRMFSEAYSRAAAIAGYAPSQLQAITWVTHRHEKGKSWAG